MARDKAHWADYMREYTARNRDKINARRRELRKLNPDKFKESDKQRYAKDPLKNKLANYKLSKEEYFKMLDAQHGDCAICGNTMTQVNIDHCHTTSKVRGLLCTACNTGIGKLKDNPRILQSAIDYLLRYKFKEE